MNGEDTPELPLEPAPEPEPAPESHETLAKAMLAIQREMPAIGRDGKSHHGAYTTLGHLLATAKPVLSRHGVTLIQFPAHNYQGGPTLRTVLLHESGDTLEAEALLTPAKPDPQGQGAALTYMRRYAAAAALGISDQEDTDGETPSVRKGKGLPQKRVDELKGAIKARKEKAGRFTFADLDLLLGAIDIDAFGVSRMTELEAKLRGLSPEQAEALEKELTG